MQPPPSSSPSPYTSEEFFQQLLRKAVTAGARDVHLKVGQPPAARVRDELVYFRVDKITPADTWAAARHLVVDPAVKEQLAQLSEYDCSYAVPGLGRFRVNVYRQRGTLAVVMRAIPHNIPTLEQLGAPAACAELAVKDRGLVLCVGAAGNGKSSTLAAMIGQMNRTMARHIVTIEDPIEYLHLDDRSSVSQREIGMDTQSFAAALRASLRQDPDVIQVGEIRDGETMEIALKAAETGHLVLSTLHTPDVARTMNRVFALAEGDHDELRMRLADSLQGIVAQRLLPRADGQGMALAAEVLVATGSVRESIRRPIGNPPLKELMEGGEHPYGMQTFAMALKRLVQSGRVDREIARAHMGF
ncbi:MAG: PilT/PilU family type 4a pilus ATPase [Polyangiaceae bacterium]|nr:PilT/PilU family type 4a pilus ATPase [Polyangiaceae bacterium]MCW5791307.1 PilT/PilU family type 4a pilus ATPase [Polyangiaceae bacterium]